MSTSEQTNGIRQRQPWEVAGFARNTTEESRNLETVETAVLAQRGLLEACIADK